MGYSLNAKNQKDKRNHNALLHMQKTSKLSYNWCIMNIYVEEDHGACCHGYMYMIIPGCTWEGV